MILAVDGGGSTCRVALDHAGSRHVVSLGAANVTSDFDGAVAVSYTHLTLPTIYSV